MKLAVPVGVIRPGSLQRHPADEGRRQDGHPEGHADGGCSEKEER
ncbi:hypothetical protein [Rubrivirga sp.]